SYRRVELDWTFGGIPLEGGTDTEALTTVETHTSTFGAGLSPFDTFEIDLATFPFDRATVQELNVVFQVEWRSSAAPVGTEACRVPEQLSTPPVVISPAPKNPKEPDPTPYPGPQPTESM